MIMNMFFVAKNDSYKDEIKFQPSDGEIIAINGRDRASHRMNCRLMMVVRSSSCG